MITLKELKNYLEKEYQVTILELDIDQSSPESVDKICGTAKFNSNSVPTIPDTYWIDFEEKTIKFMINAGALFNLIKK